MWRTAGKNGVHAVNLTATQTRTAISSNRSQQIAIIRKGGTCTTRAEATRMTSAIARKMVAVSLPLTVKVPKMGRSLRTVN